MDTPTCWPWFHNAFAKLGKAANTVVSSGCAVNSSGNVGCAPEAMRAAAEAKMRAAGLLNNLSLETYTLARYIHSEVGSGTVEERVAVGEAAVNRARMERLKNGVLSLLLYRQATGHPNRGWYGPIHGVGTGTSTAPYGRWAATSRDPTVMSILIADLITSGQSANFARGADDQAGPEAWISKGQTSLNNYVRGLASKGKYWIGPLAGVDPWHTFLTYTPGVNVNTAIGQALLARGLNAVQLPRTQPVWDPNMPSCGKPASGLALIGLGLVGTLLGAWAWSKKLWRFGEPR